MDTNKLYNQISEIINGNDNFLIITHIYPDGDSLGSQVALYQLISKLKKNVVAVCNSELPYQYKFLPYFNKIKKDLGEINISGKKYICFCLDCADENRMNIDFKVLKDNVKCIINIDHHNKNTNFGDINIVDTKKSATSEILYELIDRYYRKLLDHEIALGIYVGILTDTGKFQYSNTNYAVHKVVSELIKFNLSPSEIYRNIYENESLSRFKLIQLIFQRIEYVKSCGLIYSYVLEKDFKKLNLPYSAQDGVIELLRSVEMVRVAALIKQTGRNCFKISLRTSDSDIDLFKIASNFKGGGHRMASAYSDTGSLRTVINNLKKSIK
ncbi:MAG: bifunctional oligoribonuclease/PAP phosphatase NrnA [Actinobacteria bacterium]|nr:bifunctional oligoribonuclease/PAP phosphatase NrnA [Actinomycetota bacterium]MBL7123606.1 bifunctional oligoribonuclease/PAP phosphatase NrnA [Actinomycetota bacterium]